MPTLSPTARRTASGWTAASLTPSNSIHTAASSALVPQTTRTMLNQLTNSVLGVNNASMASRTPSTQQVNTPVGSSSVYAAGSVPSAIQSAITGLQVNTYTNALEKFLDKLAGNFTGQQAAPDPNASAYYQSKNAIMNAPADYQKKIDALLAKQQTNTGIMSINPGVPGAYENSQQKKIDDQLTSLYAAQGQAKQAASTTGWTPYMPNY